MKSVGVLGMAPWQTQVFEKLKNYDFLPIAIMVYDSTFQSEIFLPMRIGHSLNSLTGGVLGKFFRVMRNSKYGFEAYNIRICNFEKLTYGLDILQTNDIYFLQTYQAVKTKIPTIIMEYENIPFKLEIPPYAKIKKYVREHAAYFIAVTEKAKEALTLEGVSSNRISVVPGGVDCEKFKPFKRGELLKQFGISEETVNILFVGRLTPEKGILNLLFTFEKINKNFRNVSLLIAGSTSASFRLYIDKLITKLRLRNKIKFLGTNKYSLMPRVHNLADIFCMPSIPIKNWQESFGYALVESMACGKPVVSTLTGSIPEVVKNGVTGTLVDAGNINMLQKALEEFIVDEKRRRIFGENARKWVLQRFEANKIAGQLAKIYRNFI